MRRAGMIGSQVVPRVDTHLQVVDVYAENELPPEELTQIHLPTLYTQGIPETVNFSTVGRLQYRGLTCLR